MGELELLNRAKEYVQLAHDIAEARHDNYGDHYLDHHQYEIMKNTEKLLKEIDEVLK